MSIVLCLSQHASSAIRTLRPNARANLSSCLFLPAFRVSFSSCGEAWLKHRRFQSGLDTVFGMEKRVRSEVKLYLSPDSFLSPQA
jgi:hypothetical protein